jgi:enoyl-CoA hydratase/carnithine racemase
MLDLQIADQIAEITIPDVQALSRHDLAAASELRETLWEANDDLDVKVIVLRGAGPAFCPQLEHAEAPGRPREGFTQMQALFYGPHGLYQAVCYPKKVLIVEVHGECAAAGTLLALYADILVADRDAVFYSALEELPGANLMVPIMTMGLNRTKAWTMTGSALSAQEAASFGLVNYLVAPGECRAKSLEVGARIARMPLDALTTTKTGFNGVMDSSGIHEDFEMSAFFAVSRQGLSRGMGGRA